MGPSDLKMVQIKVKFPGNSKMLVSCGETSRQEWVLAANHKEQFHRIEHRKKYQFL